MSKMLHDVDATIPPKTPEDMTVKDLKAALSAKGVCSRLAEGGLSDEEDAAILSHFPSSSSGSPAAVGTTTSDEPAPRSQR